MNLIVTPNISINIYMCAMQALLKCDFGQSIELNAYATNKLNQITCFII